MNKKTEAKTLQVFLPEGSPSGIQIAELTTRIVQAVSVPRTHLKAFASRAESAAVGMYFLFGEDAEGGKPLAYIGQSEDLKQRLRQHDANKEFWTRAVILISRTQSFTQAHIKWLEWYAISQAREAKRYRLVNGNAGSEPFVTEAIQSDLWEIFETGSLLLQSLGYPVFEPLLSEGDVIEKSEVWYFSRRSAKAAASFTSEGIIVHKGSVCSDGCTPSAVKSDASFVKHRERMIKNGELEKSPQGLIFTEDYRFNSPSAAAALICGSSANGWTSWKDAQGQTLADVKRVSAEQ